MKNKEWIKDGTGFSWSPLNNASYYLYELNGLYCPIWTHGKSYKRIQRINNDDLKKEEAMKLCEQHFIDKYV